MPLRDRAYAAESSFLEWDRPTLTLKQARALVGVACKLYDVPPPKVTHHRDQAYSWSDGETISFQHQQRSRATVLHECAHHILGVLRPEITDHHSTEWLELYTWLLYRFEIVPPCAWRAVLRKNGLRGVVPGRMSPKRLGRGTGELGAKELRRL